MPSIDTQARPSIAITLGDPAGIGPELALAAAASEEVQRECLPVLVGDAALLQRVADRLALPLPPTIPAEELSTEQRHRSSSWLVDLKNLDAARVQPGCVDEATGRASFQWVEWAIEAALSGRVAAIVTGPIHKTAWHEAGIPFPGHTELLADRTGASRVRMMLTSEPISCVLATVHLGYGEVPGALTTDGVLEAIELGAAAICRMRGRPPRVVVCGLNPHAGEGGLFGNREEERIIAPAVEQAAAQGIDVVGPLSPDTAFVPDRRRTTDLYVCMYHDQGLIPLKALAFDEAVNVTLGLPLVRTSVDHGTALPMAWQGTASDRSLRAAIRLAVRLAGKDLQPLSPPS